MVNRGSQAASLDQTFEWMRGAPQPAWGCPAWRWPSAILSQGHDRPHDAVSAELDLRRRVGEPTGGSPVRGLLIEADAVVQRIPPDRLVVAVGGRELPGQDRAGPPGLPVHRIDGVQVLVALAITANCHVGPWFPMALARCTLS